VIYIYGELEGVDGIKANPLFKDAIKNATLVYTDDKEVGANYKKLGVEVRPIIKTVVPKTTKK
jgi:hypothetical protein